MKDETRCVALDHLTTLKYDGLALACGLHEEVIRKKSFPDTRVADHTNCKRSGLRSRFNGNITPELVNLFFESNIVIANVEFRTNTFTT